MLTLVNIALLVILVVSAFSACLIKDMLAAVVLFSIFSLAIAIIYQFLHAPDLAMAQIAAGGAITTTFFIIVVFRTRRKKGR